MTVLAVFLVLPWEGGRYSSGVYPGGGHQIRDIEGDYL